MKWLHQGDNWPNFYWNSRVVLPELSKVKEKIRNWEQGRLAFRDMRIIGDYDVNNYVNHLCDTGAITSKIENVDIDRKAFYRSIKNQIRDIETARSRKIERDEDGLAMMVLDANFHYPVILDKERLWQWHKWLFPRGVGDHGEELEIGQWRTTFVSVAAYEAPPPTNNRIENEMQKFLAWLESEADADEPLLKAAKSHLWFEKIHPFSDGNGRIGRAIMELMLGRAGNEKIIGVYHAMTREIGLNLWGVGENSGYYDMLGKHDVVQNHTDVYDITDWINWFLGRLSNSMNYVQKIDKSRDDRLKVFMYSCKKSLNERQKKALRHMLDLDWDAEQVWSGNLTTGRYMEITGAKRSTASKDIDNLVQQGILNPEQTASRKNWSYGLKSWNEIVQEDENKQKFGALASLRRNRKNSASESKSRPSD